MVHDVEHPGTNNTFQVSTRSPFATRYNDKAVLEAHHASAAFALMQRDGYNILKNVNLTDYTDIRGTIIDMVLHTDMETHFREVGKLKARISADEPFESKEDKLMVLGACLHAADISNPARPLMTALVWTERVLHEFFAQGDLERELGHPVGPLNDRATTNIAKCQVGFVTYVVRPLYDELLRLLPEMKACAEHLAETLAFWEPKVEHMEGEMARGTQAIPFPEEPKFGRADDGWPDEAGPRVPLTLTNDERFRDIQSAWRPATGGSSPRGPTGMRAATAPQE
jgi:cAMP-specific phosphodiesterase 4/calcium/calmodulin-dependent 3',5'-cyclic nucleotide phosphodiesterase